ncbi:unnamed protein product [Parnassius apollo]|uniref:(apollo) hypothetical protein n=1 Tax=Parnassius apollo TaxID=110799 RepID=A0A8S3X9Q3_PARAO|nr:unnamed protein product [Parnassius apollo]
MHPTSRPGRPLSWTTRRELAERLRHTAKGPLQPLQPLQSLQNLQTLHDLHTQSLNELRTFQRLHFDWPHVDRPDFIFYTPKQIQHLIRLESALGRAPAMATLPPAWHRQPPVTTQSPYESGGGQLGSNEWNAWGAWGNLASGWAAGAVLLLAALLLVRYIDRCLARKLLNYQFPIIDGDSESFPRLSDFDASPSETSGDLRNCDLPPPYSECTEPATGNKQTITEEPPPPYSACYVAFSNPKDGVPSVHIYNEQGQSLPSDSHNSSSLNEHAGVSERSIELVDNKPNNGCERNSTDNTETNESDTNVLNHAIASTSNANDRVESGSYIIDIDIINALPGEVC